MQMNGSISSHQLHPTQMQFAPTDSRLHRERRCRLRRTCVPSLPGSLELRIPPVRRPKSNSPDQCGCDGACEEGRLASSARNIFRQTALSSSHLEQERQTQTDYGSSCQCARYPPNFCLRVCLGQCLEGYEYLLWGFGSWASQAPGRHHVV